jgi:hypothetical protein
MWGCSPLLLLLLLLLLQRQLLGVLLPLSLTCP